jgi:hypothetical protein
LSLRRMTRSPASASENRAHGAEKIGPRRYSDFFKRIDPWRTLDAVLHSFVGLRDREIGHVGWAPHHRQDLGVTSSHVLVQADGAWRSALHTAR